MGLSRLGSFAPDTESVPLAERIEVFFEKPSVPDAWIDTDKRDPRDGEVGIVGYEINSNRSRRFDLQNVGGCAQHPTFCKMRNANAD